MSANEQREVLNNLLKEWDERYKLVNGKVVKRKRISIDEIINLANQNNTKWVEEYVKHGKGHGQRLTTQLLNKVYPNGELDTFDVDDINLIFIHHLCLETLKPLSHDELIEDINHVHKLGLELA